MSYGVMVAQQVLVLFVEVRILVGQQRKKSSICSTFCVVYCDFLSLIFIEYTFVSLGVKPAER